MEVASSQAPKSVHSRRRSVFRSVLVLLVGTAGLFVFIMVQGDVRRQQLAVAQAEWQAARLADRLGDTATLPLNLEPVSDPLRKGRMFRIEWLARDDALHLRRSAKPVIAAQTVPLPRFFAPDGRAVILFEAGRFHVKWVTLAEFDRLYAEQEEEIRRLSAVDPDKTSAP